MKLEVNVEIVLSYNDEETDWKVKKIFLDSYTD